MDFPMSHKISGVKFYEDNQGHHITFDDGLAEDTFSALIALMQQDSLEFGLFDPRYPSPSDPGAYFKYRPNVSSWQMTLGNHGWSGGIYSITPALIAKQLYSLYHAKLLEPLNLDKVYFSAHYAIESESKNKAMIELLERIHT